jgi:dimethylargininase
MFSKAIVRTPCKNMIHGITTAKLGKPDYHRALDQHQQYIAALQICGLEVTILDADERYPDSTFVEDTALLTPMCAILTNPGAASRKGEISEIKNTIRSFYTNLECIHDPGTLDAGDVMMAGRHYYIGLSGRTNKAGAEQLITLLHTYGMTGSTVVLENVLHLKTGVAYLENNVLVASGEFLKQPQFQKYNILNIDAEERYAANCVWINGRILLPKGYPKATRTIENAGFDILELDVSEFRKLDGGLSCLSLRF